MVGVLPSPYEPGKTLSTFEVVSRTARGRLAGHRVSFVGTGPFFVSGPCLSLEYPRTDRDPYDTKLVLRLVPQNLSRVVVVDVVT